MSLDMSTKPKLITVTPTTIPVFPRAHIGIGWLTTVPGYGFGAHKGWEEQNKRRLTSSTSSALVSSSGTKKTSGWGHFGNFLADGFRTSGPSQSSSAPSKTVNKLWVDTKFYPFSKEHPRSVYLRLLLLVITRFGGVKMVEMVIFEHGEHNDTTERKIRPRLPLEY